MIASEDQRTVKEMWDSGEKECQQSVKIAMPITGVESTTTVIGICFNKISIH